MKTDFLNYNQTDVLANCVSDNFNINKKILSEILNNNTFFENCFGNSNLLKRITCDTFSGLIKNKVLYNIDNVQDIVNRLEILIKKCVEIETPIRDNLEKACFNAVINFFDIPDDFIVFDFKLCDDITVNHEYVLTDPFDDDNFIDSDEIDITNEVNKRKILLALCVGAGMCASRNFDLYCNEIPSGYDELKNIYHEILILNTVLLFIKNDDEITDMDNKQIGYSIIKFGSKENKTHISVKGKIFPVLFAEAIRALMELFISHGLPKNKTVAKSIIGKTDFIKSDPWLMRIGPRLWSLFSKGFYDIDTCDVPYVMKNLSQMDYAILREMINGTIDKTKNYKIMLKKILSQSKKDSEHLKFLDRMSTMQVEKGIIMDDYIHPEEL
jgi:hypothetical protein